MRPLKVFLTIDVAIQGALLLGLAVFTTLTFVFPDSSGELGLTAFWLMLILGAVQMIAALVLSIIGNNSLHGLYAIIALTGFPAIALLSGAVSSLTGTFVPVLIALFVLPIIGAIYYFTVTTKDYVREMSRPVSFWNLQ